jgi:hypothetical protein
MGAPEALGIIGHLSFVLYLGASNEKKRTGYSPSLCLSSHGLSSDWVGHGAAGVTGCRWRVMFISLGKKFNDANLQACIFSKQISLYCGLHKNDKILEIWIYTYWDHHVCKTQTTSRFGSTNFIPCNKTLCKFKMSAFCWNLLTVAWLATIPTHHSPYTTPQIPPT